MRRALLGIGIALSFLSAGLIIGLGFIAAAVKFTATRPDVLDLLNVGLVQFDALHTAEAILLPATLLCLTLAAPRLWKSYTLTAALFLFQSLVILPPLHARMLARLAEQPVLPASHQAYVAVALAIVASLILQGILAMRALTQSQAAPQTRTRTSSEAPPVATQKAS